MHKALWDSVLFLSKTKRKYESLKSNEETRGRSVTLGVHAIVSAIVTAVLAALTAVGLLFCVRGIDTSLVLFAIVGAAALAAALLLELIFGFIASLVYVIYQLKLNRRPIGWIALAVWFICIAGAIIAAILVADML